MLGWRNGGLVRAVVEQLASALSVTKSTPVRKNVIFFTVCWDFFSYNIGDFWLGCDDTYLHICILLVEK